MALIIIDPGHGGHDPGAVGSRSKEKDNVLKVALRLKELLESHGHRVVLTRFKDKYLTLSERARIANELGADYFISLHNNAAVNKSASGFETFIYNGNVSQKTKDFQRIVHSAIASKIGIRDRGMKRANFSVLRNTKMVALLIEYGFITNTEDENILINKVNNLAQWTCDGIINVIGGRVKEQAKPQPKKTTEKSVDQLAREVIAGKWGSGRERKLRLGHRYDAVQKRVNEIMREKQKPKKTVSQLADEVIKGLHGNGEQRKKSLGSQYEAVQREINRRLK